MSKGVKFARSALVGALMLTVAGCRLASQSGSPTLETSPSLAPSSGPSASAATSTPLPPDFNVSWTEMPFSGAVHGVSFDPELGVWMAFGTEEMWTSPDGISWDRHEVEGELIEDCCPHPLPTWMIESVRMQDRLWAAGVFDNDNDGLGLLMWSSADGANWDIVAQGGWDGFWAHGIASNGSVMAVANSSYFVGGGEVMTSDVGSGWTSYQPGGGATMMDVYGDPDGFVAVGYRIEAPPYAPVIWTSANGSVWNDASPESAEGRMSSVARGQDGSYVAAGLDKDGSIQIWHTDGIGGWKSRGLPSSGLDPYDWQPQLQLVASGGRFVLVAATELGWWFWTSNDGESWSTGNPLPAADGGLGPFVAFAGDRVVVFTGDSGDRESSTLLVGQVVPAE